jgi:hypothetical protein
MITSIRSGIPAEEQRRELEGLYLKNNRRSFAFAFVLERKSRNAFCPRIFLDSNWSRNF